MRPPAKIAIVLIAAWMGIHVNPAAAQNFEERWSIIPKAHAEEPPAAERQMKSYPEKPSTAVAEPTRRSENASANRSLKRSFSGKASYYSYPGGKNGERFFVQPEFANRRPPESAVWHESARD